MRTIRGSIAWFLLAAALLLRLAVWVLSLPSVWLWACGALAVFGGALALFERSRLGRGYDPGA